MAWLERSIDNRVEQTGEKSHRDFNTARISHRRLNTEPKMAPHTGSGDDAFGRGALRDAAAFGWRPVD